jgi:glutamate racemase
VGGLTVLQALRERLPAEDYLYLGDTARLPYGTKSPATVQRYAVNAARYLVDGGIKLLVVACNTASSYALAEVSAACPVPVVGVVDPGVRAALASGARRIGVIGTEGTVRSEAYQRALRRAAPEVKVEATACPLFVPLAEEGWGDHPVTDQVAEIYLRPLLDLGVDAIILGCTHYPLLCRWRAGPAGGLRHRGGRHRCGGARRHDGHLGRSRG